MKCLSLYQPWASFISEGVKTIETRAWRQPSCIGQRIAIHAGKNQTEGKAVPHWIRLGGSPPPYGAIVCTAIVWAIVRAEDVFVRFYPERENQRELSLGNYEPGRWAWVLSDVKRLSAPIPCRGFQRLWNLDAATVIEIRKRGGL